MGCELPQASALGFLPLEPGLRSLLPLSGSSRLHPGREWHVHDAPCPALLPVSASTSGSSEASSHGKPSRAHDACYACYAWGQPTHVILLLIYKYSAIHPQAKAWGTLALNFVERKIITAWKCDEFLLESFTHSASFILVMRKSGKVRRYILPADTKFMLRDVLSPIEHYNILHEMFKEYYDKLSDAAESNSEILREMREIAAPYILSENI